MGLSNRRDFMQTSLAVAAGVAVLPQVLGGANLATGDGAGRDLQPKAHPSKQVLELGPEKIRVSRMAMGTGTYGAGYSSNQLRNLGAEGLGDLLTHAYENGVFFWDSSDSYGTHVGIKSALTKNKVPRDKVTILTKTPAVSAAQLKLDLDRFLKELGTDYIDIILLHSRTEANWETTDKGVMDALSEAKQKKIVRSVGCSIHSLEALGSVAKSKWLEICMARLNPGGIRMDGSAGGGAAAAGGNQEGRQGDREYQGSGGGTTGGPH